MLCVLEECSDEERKQIIEQIRECSTEEQSVALQQMVAERGGIAAAERTMRQYIESATRILSHYPQSEYRDSLMTLCAYIGERNK
jgi:geranylgeranyl pyrophosphate synthase